MPPTQPVTSPQWSGGRNIANVRCIATNLSYVPQEETRIRVRAAATEMLCPMAESCPAVSCSFLPNLYANGIDYVRNVLPQSLPYQDIVLNDVLPLHPQNYLPFFFSVAKTVLFCANQFVTSCFYWTCIFQLLLVLVVILSRILFFLSRLTFNEQLRISNISFIVFHISFLESFA